MTIRFDPTAPLITVASRLFGPGGNAAVGLALDRGASVTVVGWDALLALGYDPSKDNLR